MPACVAGVISVDETLRLLTLSRVTDAIRRSLSISDLHMTPATRLSEDLGLDSLDVVEVAMALEESFDTEFPQEAIRQFSVVGDIVAYLNGRYFRDVADQIPVYQVA